MTPPVRPARPAVPADIPALEAFLARHAETSMFLRQSLTLGVAGGAAPHAARFWWLEEGVFALSAAGFLAVQAPGLGPPGARAIRAALAGELLAGITGEGRQVAALLPHLGLPEAAFAHVGEEPLYRLDLAGFDPGRLPLAAGDLRPVREADLAWLPRWRLAYEREMLGTGTAARARAQVEAAVRAGRLRLLWQGGVPVAMTAFNARLERPAAMVQVGGVYTPPAFRGRAFARTAVARHLAEAAAEGLRTAILFASGPPAMRAYEAIGFERVGRHTLAILHPGARVA